MFAFAMRIPAGLRSHTPMSHTASTPDAAIASHSSDGTMPSVIVRLYCLLKSLSHTQVLISYMMGRAGHSAFMGYLSFSEEVGGVSIIEVCCFLSTRGFN